MKLKIKSKNTSPPKGISGSNLSMKPSMILNCSVGIISTRARIPQSCTQSGWKTKIWKTHAILTKKLTSLRIAWKRRNIIIYSLLSSTRTKVSYLLICFSLKVSANFLTQNTAFWLMWGSNQRRKLFTTWGSTWRKNQNVEEFAGIWVCNLKILLMNWVIDKMDTKRKIWIAWRSSQKILSPYRELNNSSTTLPICWISLLKLHLDIFTCCLELFLATVGKLWKVLNILKNSILLTKMNLLRHKEISALWVIWKMIMSKPLWRDIWKRHWQINHKFHWRTLTCTWQKTVLCVWESILWGMIWIIFRTQDLQWILSLHWPVFSVSEEGGSMVLGLRLTMCGVILMKEPLLNFWFSWYTILSFKRWHGLPQLSFI